MSRFKMLQQLYQIASRRSDDPYEELSFQLRDGLKTVANYWQMNAALVCEADGEYLRISHFYTERSSDRLSLNQGALEPAGRVSSLSQSVAEARARDVNLLPLLIEAREVPISEVDNDFYHSLFNRGPAPIQATIPPLQWRSGRGADSNSVWAQIMAASVCYISMPIYNNAQRSAALVLLATYPNSPPLGSALTNEFTDEFTEEFPGALKIAFNDEAREDLQLFANWVHSALERSQMRNERAQDQSDLARINREIARSNSDLDHFVYIASHDLKEPLRGISQYAQFLTEDYSGILDDEGKRMLRALIEQSQRMGKQIDDLRFFSRIGRHASGIDIVDLNDIVVDVRATLRTLLDEKDVGIRIPRSLPSVKGNAALITTVFQNLMANAARYNDKEHKWIQITWGVQEQGSSDQEVPSGIDADGEPAKDEVSAMIRSLQEGRGKTVITIADNGIGIREQDKDAIFTMFRRLHNQGAYGGGTGAGLAIVKRILEEEGGTIWFDSKVGVGTQFHFTFE